MGWLFGCFGGGRQEKLPRLCSRSSRHHKTRDYVKSQPRLSPFGTALGSGRPLLKNGSTTTEAQFKRDLDLQVAAAVHPSAKITETVLKEEQLRSYLQTAAEPPKTCTPCRIEVPHPVFDNPSSSVVQALERYTCENASPDSGMISEASIAEEVQCELSSIKTQETTQNLQVSSLPRASGFFMLPKKRSCGYRSFVWQEPLSPVAEAESSISSEEEEKSIKSLQNITKFSSGCLVLDESSDSEITTPVRCSSPILERVCPKKSNERNDCVDFKENLFLGVLTTECSSGRQNQASVLTPVGNLVQWRQLKGDPWSYKMSKTTEVESEDDELEVDAEKYSFFKELQQNSSEVVGPQQQLRPCSPASRWGDAILLPNTTTKYKEDQKVSWHSTPFETRLDKALASQSAAPPRTLF